MEIVTHVLTSEQNLDENRQKIARNNIKAVSGAKVRGEQEPLPVDENGIIEIPSGTVVGEGVLTITDGNTTLGQFGANQATDTSIDIGGKADKVSDATEGDLAGLDANGNPTDSGVSISAVSDAIDDSHTHDNKSILDEVTAPYTTEEHAKLDGIEDGAQVNVIETVQVNGTALPVNDKTVNITIDTSDKADKVSGATSGNFAGLDGNGNLTDSGSKAADFATAAQGALADTAYQKPAGGIPKADLAQSVQDSLDKADTALQSDDIVGKEDKSNKVDAWSGTPTDEHYPTEKLVKDSLDQINTDLDDKADKVANATNGNFAGLDANGNLTDSGSKAADFATAAQGALADTAYQKPVDGIPKADLSEGVQTSLGLADTALQEHQDISGKEDKSNKVDTWSATPTDEHYPTEKLVKDSLDQIDADLDDKADKVANANDGNFAGLDANGNLTDSGKSPEDFIESVTQSVNNGYVSVDGTDVQVYVHPAHSAQNSGLYKITVDAEGHVSAVAQVAGTDILDLLPVDTTYFAKTNNQLNLVVTKSDVYISTIGGARIQAVVDSNGDNIFESLEALRALLNGHAVFVAAESDLPATGDSSKVYYVGPKGTGDDKYDVFVWKASASQYIKVDEASIDLSGYVLKVANPTAGNLASLTADGGIANSGYSASDMVHGVILNGTELQKDASHKVSMNFEAVLPPVGDNEDMILAGEGNETPTVSWKKLKKDYVGDRVEDNNGNQVLDENNQPVVDENSEILWVSYKDVEFGARRAYEDHTGENIHDAIVKINSINPSDNDPAMDGAASAGVSNDYSRADHVHPKDTTKADKVSGATEGNFAGLDSNGNLTDSGQKAADFATAAQGAKADSAVQGVQKNGTDITLDANKKANVVVNDAEFKVKLGSGSAAKVFSADADTDSTLTIPLAAADSSGATTVYTEGLMAGEDKEKLDGITDYVVSASVSGRTLTLTNKNGPDTTFTDTGDTNVIESISVNGTAQTVTNKNVDLTIPDAANDATITIEVGGAASGETAPVAGDFSTDQDIAETITIPAAVSATQNTPAQPGVMSSADKEKLDGIEAGAEVNVIESISVNGTAQTVTNKNVDITVPTVNDGELSITVGSGSAVTFTANQSSNTSVTVPLASKDTSGATPVYSEGLMTSAQNEKLDGIAAGADVNVIESITMEGESNPLAIVNKDVEIPLATSSTPGLMSAQDKDALDSIAAFSSIQVTSGSTTGQVDADSAAETLNLVAGDNITITANDTTKTIEISASLGEELGFLSGSATVNGIVNNGDVLTDPLTGMIDSNNGRFIIDTDTTDGHVYLYALKSIPDLVNGVDLFTISVNSNVSRTTANGFYGVAGLEILHKDNGNSLITESTESYASQVGECSVDLTVTVKNSTGTVTTIDGVDYYGYLIRYSGDSTASGDAINVVTRISVIEETVGIVEYNGSQSSLSAGNGISIDNDTINAKLGDGLGLDANNNIEVKVGAGLKIDTSGGVATVAIDNVTEEVVETVQKLGEDLDKKITTTFPYAQITTMSDYMTYGTQGENRMFGQLFSVPITSELRVDDTVICVNALQSAPSIDVVFGIFEYDFSANNGSGSTYWLADTGVVHVSAGDNAFPIKNLISDVTRPSVELKSSCLYYAVWAIHNTGASNGLSLASCPGYGANYNAIPRYTVKTSGASVQVNWAGDGCLRSSWFSGYNEDNSIPRLFMMVRNKSDIQPSGNDPFINITDYELNDQYTINQIFGSTAPSADGAVFQKVIPARAVNITKFEWADTKSTVTATSSSPMVMDNSFGTTLTLADGTLTTAQDGDYYVHTFTLTNALAMTAGTVYWLPAQYNTVTETGMSDGGDNKLVQYSTNVARRDLQMIVDMAQPSGSGEFKASQTGVYLKLYDDNNNSWVI